MSGFIFSKAKEAFTLQIEAEKKVRQEQNIQIAKKLLKRGLSNVEIVEDTDLTIEQIRQLRYEKSN